MEKDGAAAGHRRHRPGPGALPAGAAAGHARTAGEVAELQRSRSVGGLHQKGDPPSCLRKPRKEPESEDPGKDPRSDVEDSSCQAEADAGEKEEGDLAQAEPAAGRTEPEPEKGGPEPSATGEPQGERGEQCGGEAKEPEPESVKLKDPEKEASALCHGGTSGMGRPVQAPVPPATSLPRTVAGVISAGGELKGGPSPTLCAHGGVRAWLARRCGHRQCVGAGRGDLV
nr:uncharacterized protein LOC105871896 [Microcebus murinus]